MLCTPGQGSEPEQEGDHALQLLEAFKIETPCEVYLCVVILDGFFFCEY